MKKRKPVSLGYMVDSYTREEYRNNNGKSEYRNLWGSYSYLWKPVINGPLTVEELKEHCELEGSEYKRTIKLDSPVVFNAIQKPGKKYWYVAWKGQIISGPYWSQKKTKQIADLMTQGMSVVKAESETFLWCSLKYKFWEIYFSFKDRNDRF